MRGTAKENGLLQYNHDASSTEHENSTPETVEVLAELLFPVDNNLGEVLKDLGRQFKDDAKATILCLNQALKDVPRTRNESRVNIPLVAASNDAVREYFRSHHGLKEDEISQLVKLLESFECEEGKVKEITQSFEKYTANPRLFWTSFSSLHAGNSIQQTVNAIEHHSSSSALARRLLCRRLAAQIESKAQELKKQGHALRPGMSYRDLALRLSVGQDWKETQIQAARGRTMVLSGCWYASCDQGYKLEKVNIKSIFGSLIDQSQLGPYEQGWHPCY